MSRWRPPAEASSPLITAAGLERLRAELDELWNVRRPEVVAALSAAAAEGDRSENAEYIYRKKQLAEIDRRVRYLSKRIPALRPAHALPTDATAVFFGAWFSVEDEDGDMNPEQNPFSGASYRMVNFITDFPVRVDHLVDVSRYATTLGRSVFVMVEFQVLDQETSDANELGENAHELYKERQRAIVAARLRKGARWKRRDQE